MPLYRITAPNGQTYEIEGPPGASDAEVAQAVMAQHPEAGRAAPETTVGGNIKEAVKGVLPGAVGLLESAATGASALLPDEMEPAVREKIASIAGAAKKPFAAAEGYEESVGRRIGEGLGSILPVAPLGFLGLPGVAAGVGVGLASGAGEARVRAEQAGATAEERGTATAAGTIPGAFDTAIDMALAALPGGVGKSLSVVRRALVSGGVEGATEAAQAIAQNLIAKGVYKPDQALLESAGEEGAYGAGVGAIASVLLDMAIPGRSHVSKLPKPPAQEKPGAEPGAQGEMFTPAEMGVGRAPATAAEQAITEPAAATPEGQMDLGLDFQREIEQLYLERERLKQAEQTTEVKQRVADLSDQISSYEEMSVAERRAQAATEAEQAAKDARGRETFPALANAPELMAQSDEVKARTQGDLFGGEPAAITPAAAEPMEPNAPTPVPPYARTGPYQYKLPLRAQPTPTTFTMQDVENTGIAPSTTRGWFEQNVAGKTQAEVQQLVTKDPSLLEGKGKRAKILRELLAPQAAPFTEEKPRVPKAPIPKAEQRPEPGASEPSVAVPSEPAGVQPPTVPVADTGTPVGAEGPVSSGLVPAGEPAGQRDAAERAQPAAVKEAPLPEAPKPAAVQRLESARTQAEFNAAMDELVAIQRAAEHPDKDAVGEFIGSNVTKYPEFERALQAAELRNRPKQQAPAAPAVRAEEPKAKKPFVPRKNDAFYEPVGIDPKTGKVIRGPQLLIQPIDDARAKQYLEAKAADVGTGEDIRDLFADIDAEIEAEAAQPELDFNAPIQEPRVEDAAPVKTPTPSDEATLKAIDGKPMLDVAQWAAKNLPDPDQKVIAQRVLVKLRQLEELGVTLKPIQVTPEGRHLIGARGVTKLAKNRATGGPTSIEIVLNHPSNGADAGTNPETILHELLHAATMGTIELGRYKSAAGTKVGDATRELMALTEAVIKHFNARAANGQAGLTDFEKKIYARANNALADQHEVLVWALTNRDMQQYMESIPYKGQTAWNKFVTFIRDLLGIPAKADTALSEALRVGDTLLGLSKEDIKGVEQQTGKQFQVSASTESLVDSMGDLDPQTKRSLKDLITGFKQQGELGYAVKFRTQTADAAATIEHRLREQFDGAVRDSMGKLNPMGLYRQAQDYTKTLLEFFQTGGLTKDPATGLWVVENKAGVRPPSEVYALIDAWGAKNGYSRERATQIASRIMEGVRLDAMRTANKTQGTGFLLHLKDNEIDQLVAEYKADPDLQAMSKAMDESRLAMVDNMVAVGRLTPEQGAEWKNVAGYVPFDRIDDFANAFTKIKKVSNKGLAQVGKLPELVGSINRPVGNVFDNYLNTLGWMVGQTMKTDGTVQTLRSLEKLGFANFLGRSTQQKPNTVGGYVNGEMMYWELPSKYDVLAFKDLNPPKAGWLRNLGKFSNVLRKSVTALPPFALKQVTDDVQRAIMTSGVKNPGALLRMSLSNFGGLAFAELRGIQHPSVKQFGRMGLTGEYDFEAGKPATSLLKDLGYKKRGKFETLMHRLDGITRASDLAVRKAIYDQTLKETNDQLLAQTRAREFINFRRRGASDFVGAMVTTIPFFNAYIQGMDVLYRAASGKDSSSSVGRAQARRMFWTRAAVVMMLSSLYALGAGDDEDYQEMDLRTRDGNWILPGGFKMPVPGELGALFKVIPERVVEYMRRQGTPEEQTAWEATRTGLSYILEQYVGRVTPVPQAVKPLLEAWTNYSFFTGRELEGIYQKQQDPSQRRASNTSELAIAIANFARDVVGVDKVSPILVDNALNGYFGSTAGLLVAATDSLLNPTRVDRPLHKWALVSNYMYDPVGTRRMTEFYEEREKVGRANATLNELAKTDMDKAADYAEKNADILMLESAVNSTLEQLERTRAYRKYLNSPLGAEGMPKDAREAELQELRKIEVELTGWLREAKASLR